MGFSGELFHNVVAILILEKVAVISHRATFPSFANFYEFFQFPYMMYGDDVGGDELCFALFSASFAGFYCSTASQLFIFSIT